MAWKGRPRGWLAAASVLVFWSGAAAQCTPGNINTAKEMNSYVNCTAPIGDVTIANFIIDSQYPLKVFFENVMGFLNISNITAADDSGHEVSLDLDLSALKDVSNLILEDLQLSAIPDLSNVGSAQSLVFTNVAFGATNGQSTGGSGLDTAAVYEYGAFRTMTFQGCPGLQSIRPVVDGTSELDGEASFTATGNPDLIDIELARNSDSLNIIAIQDNSPSITVKLTDIDSASFNLVGVQTLDATSLTHLGDNGSSSGSTISNTVMTSLYLPNLTSASNLSITDNLKLTDIELPMLQEVSMLNISDRAKLDTVILSNLTTVGTLLISGTVLDNVTYPSHVNVSEGFKIESNNSSLCPHLHSPGSRYSCGAVPAEPTAHSSSSSADTTASNSGSGGSGGLSTGAKAGIGVGVSLGVLLIIIGLAICIPRRRKSKARTSQTPSSKEFLAPEHEPTDRSSIRYSKAPVISDGYRQVRDTSESYRDITSPHDQRPVSTVLADDWAPPEQQVPSAEGRVELEEQQGPRHEMDARSLPDIDFDGDDGDDTRSLQDIEWAHGHRV